MNEEIRKHPMGFKPLQRRTIQIVLLKSIILITRPRNYLTKAWFGTVFGLANITCANCSSFMLIRAGMCVLSMPLCGEAMSVVSQFLYCHLLALSVCE